MSQRSLLIALFVSLAVNLFAIGAVIGGLVVAGRVGERLDSIRPGPPAVFGAAEALPPERQDAYRQALRGEAGQVRRTLREAGEARREAWRTLGETPLDTTAVRRDLARAQAIEAEARRAVEDRVIDFAATLEEDERRAFAEALARPPRHMERRRGDRPPGP